MTKDSAPQKTPSSVKRKTAEQTLNDICTRRPALAAVLSAFIPLYAAREALVKTLRPMIPDVPELHDVSLERLQNGVPLLTDASFDWVDVPFRAAFATLGPLLSCQPPLSEAVERFGKALDETGPNGATPSRLAGVCLSGDATGVERLAADCGISPTMLVFLTHQTLGPVLHAAWQTQQPEVPFTSWREGNCPVCGSFPSLGFLNRPDATQSEYAKGGGGRKFLHCSLCGYEWHFRRGACPACANEDPGAIEFLRAPETPWERIEFCRKCNTYVTGLDLRESLDTPDMDAAALGMMHLDLLAAKEGLHPLAPAFWNTFE